jgi:hypothetical protein
MTSMQSEVFEAFRDMSAAEDKALRAAGALAKRDDDVAAIKGDVLLMKRMLGLVLAFQIAFDFKLFAH